MEHKRVFTFSTSSHTVPQYTEQALNFIKEKIEDRYPDAFFSKIKWVFVELLSNAAKHAAAETVEMDIAVDDEKIILQKRDTGKPLQLPPHKQRGWLKWPLADIPAERRIMVYEDSVNSLCADIGDDGTLTFFVSPCGQPTTFSINNLAEHFGLLIIARSVDGFVYNYDETRQINSFTCVINLK